MMMNLRMNYFLFCSVALASPATFSSVIALPSSAAFPADSQELRLSRDSDIGELKNLLNQGDLVKFYQTAHTHMGQLEWSGIRGGVSPDKLDRLLLIARITSAAPLFGENENTPFEQMTPDFDLKMTFLSKGSYGRSGYHFQNQSQAKILCREKERSGAALLHLRGNEQKMMKELLQASF
ncbi:hypothetical protein [Akkermansia muciniphila]|uniref:hypothetical protein n=1 Tax=Akkermansia muciniphila TaxID=239935 RepID=UPI0004F2C430|nr:hypothetical protein [Akkermansia muciniphila]